MIGHHRYLLPLAMALLVVATFAAYSTSLRAPFQFDDLVGIVENVTIRKLWPLLGDTGPLRPPVRTPVVHRPTVNVSLALNYAFNDVVGIDNRGPWAPFFYRVVNIIVHLASAFLLMGIIRRTLRHGWIGEKFANVADLAAIVVVFIWTLHPIQSEALLYIVQRTELLMAICYLGALYCSIRAWDARSVAAAAGWYLGAVVVGLMGMGCKEVMISMPLAVMLYDRAFRNESWRQAFGRRWWFYGLLCLTTALLVSSMAVGPRSNSIGFHLGVAWFEYLYTQGWAILHYVQLFFWPDRLTLDYGPQMIRDARGAMGAIALTVFGVLTAAVWIKPRWWAWWVAFAGALTAVIVDILVRGTGDRLYVPLTMAALITFFVIAALETVGRFVRVSGWVWLLGTLAAWAMVLGLLPLRLVSFAPAATHERDAYMAIASFLVLSTFVLRVLAPRMPIDRWGWFGFLGAWFFLILAPSSSVVPIVTEVAAERRIYLSLVSVIVLVLLGVEMLRRKLDDPTDARGRLVQGCAFVAVAIFYLWVSGWVAHRRIEPFGPPEVARLVMEWTVRLIVAAGAAAVAYVIVRARSTVRTATFGIMMIVLVVVTAMRGDLYNDPEAIWRDVTVKVPDNPRGWDGLGSVLALKGRVSDGETALRRSLAVDPEYLPGWHKLGVLAIGQGRMEEGRGLLQRAITLAPNYSPSLSKLGALLIDVGRAQEAIAYLERAVAGEPTAEDWSTFGVALSQTGQYDKALNAFDTSLKLDPYQTTARINKAGALVNAGRYADAVPELRTVLTLDPRSVVAQANLALAYAGLGQADQAIRAGEHAIELAPQSAQLGVMVGTLLNRFGRFAEAEQQLTLVMLFAPENPDALFQLGVAWHYLGKRDEAIAAFRQVLQANGNYRPAREALEALAAQRPMPK